MKELWSPSFDFGDFALSLIMESFNNALRDKSIATKIKPFGYNYSIESAL
jgi:hypothetical protein